MATSLVKLKVYVWDSPTPSNKWRFLGIPRYRTKSKASWWPLLRWGGASQEWNLQYHTKMKRSKWMNASGKANVLSNAFPCCWFQSCRVNFLMNFRQIPPAWISWRDCSKKIQPDFSSVRKSLLISFKRLIGKNTTFESQRMIPISDFFPIWWPYKHGWLNPKFGWLELASKSIPDLKRPCLGRSHSLISGYPPKNWGGLTTHYWRWFDHYKLGYRIASPVNKHSYCSWKVPIVLCYSIFWWERYVGITCKKKDGFFCYPIFWSDIIHWNWCNSPFEFHRRTWEPAFTTDVLWPSLCWFGTSQADGLCWKVE